MYDYVDVTMCFVFRGMLPRYPGFRLVGPPPAGNSNLVIFWPILGLWQLGKFWAENTKPQFSGARATFFFCRVGVTTLSGMLVCSFLGKGLFFWSGPHRPGIAIWWSLGPFWPIYQFTSLPKRAKVPLNHCFRLVGVRARKKNLFPRKLQKTIPDSLGTYIFSISGTCCFGAQQRR